MTAIGPFKIHRVLGQGGMATVYLAEHPALGRVALRVIPKLDTKEQREIVDAERVGAHSHRALSEAGCPWTPHAHEPYEDEHYFCAPVEFVEGRTLKQHLEERALTEAEAVTIGIALCQNLEFAHANEPPVIHGDVKPANIMVTLEREIRVLDYGISKPLQRNQDRTRNVFGAACYSSPERLIHKRLDAQADLWSAGVMLYEMVSRRRPYDGAEAEVKALFERGQTPAPLREASASYQAVVVKALSLRPGDRYPSASSLMADLERLGRGEVPWTAAAAKPSNDHTVRDSGATVRMPPPPPGPVRGGNTGWAARIAIGFCLCLVAAAFWFLSRESALAREAGAFVRDLRSRNDVTAADWSAYEALEKRATFGWTLHESRHVLAGRLKDSAFRAIKDYREGYNLALSGARRQAAELALKRAQILDPGDRETRAMALIVEAYGSAWTNELAARNAITTFEQAAGFWRESPDPYLGIARVAAYQLREPERLEQAIDEAVRRGYKRIERDTAMLADCRRAKADQTLRALRKSSCEDFDHKLLDRVRGLLAQAIDDYRQIPEFSGTFKSLEVSRKLLEDAQGLCAPAAPTPLPQ